ncbi:MAG TPA: amidohydrolase family protein [Terriglobales bacterium]|nr:amidohydrolase family protein [Terriglobales bacterium]
MNQKLLEYDRELFARELETFIPRTVFDAHAHIYNISHFKGDIPKCCSGGPNSVGCLEIERELAALMPRRNISGLFFGFPAVGLDFEAANLFTADEAHHDPRSRAHMLVHPSMDPEQVRETVRSDGFVGLKCYHLWSSEQPTLNASIPSFLTEEHVRVAHEEGLSITLHIVRDRSIDDASNQSVIRRYAERYPRARFILAHAARGFNSYHASLGMGSLKGLRNVWCDTSAVTESGALEVAIRTLGVDRLLYGSDFPVSHERGRCVTIGDSFMWLSAENARFDSGFRTVKPTLVGIEALRALKLACWNLRLGDSEVEAIFYGNAASLFSLY